MKGMLEGIVIHGAMGECGGVHLFLCRVCTQGCRKNVRVFFGELFRPKGRNHSERAEPDAVLLSCVGLQAKRGSKGEL